MRRRWLLIPCLILSLSLFAQQGGIEQYHYISQAGFNAVVPVLHLQTKKGWYGEARYNYDEKNTFSILAGKTFSSNNQWEWSITPMVGLTFGELNGWTTGVNFSLEKSGLFFNTQSQYTFSTTPSYDNFLFNWCEAGYQPLNWLYGGVSLQHTQLPGSAALIEPGIVAGICFKKISFPIYVFNTFNRNRFFILGVNWEWKHY